MTNEIIFFADENEDLLLHSFLTVWTGALRHRFFLSNQHICFRTNALRTMFEHIDISQCWIIPWYGIYVKKRDLWNTLFANFISIFIHMCSKYLFWRWNVGLCVESAISTCFIKPSFRLRSFNLHINKLEIVHYLHMVFKHMIGIYTDPLINKPICSIVVPLLVLKLLVDVLH